MLARGRPVRSVLTDLPSCELVDNARALTAYVKVLSEPILLESSELLGRKTRLPLLARGSGAPLLKCPHSAVKAEPVATRLLISVRSVPIRPYAADGIPSEGR